MNARRRSRRSKNKQPGQQGQDTRSNQRASTPSKEKTKGRSPKEIAAFWGDSSALPEAPTQLRITTDATAMVRSLGRVPLPGQETAAEHYLDSIYNRAVMLASALGAAGDLLEPEDLTS